jgi:hypothetical protein
MRTYKIQEILKEVLSKNQLSLLDTEVLDKELLLEEVVDINSYIQKCNDESIFFKVAGEHRQQDWETGWAGDGVYYSDDEYNNLPYYFKNNSHIRVGQKVFKDISGFAEVNLLRALQVIVFREFLSKIPVRVVFEYGCGTGSNIQYLRRRFPGLDFYGSDWVESACRKLIENKILDQEKVRLVNYFDVDTFSGASIAYAAFTNASLEQSGDRYKDFMEFLVGNPMCLGGIHIEPIRELLDLSNPLNVQSFKYAEKRGYLTDFYQNLKSLEVEILVAKDFSIGSKHINGYQVICWRKKK